MPNEEPEEYREIARQMAKDGTECCVVCGHWDQHGPRTGQYAKSEFIAYLGPGPERYFGLRRFKVATEGTWSCPEFERRPID